MKERGKVLARNPQSFLPKVRAAVALGRCSAASICIWKIRSDDKGI